MTEVKIPHASVALIALGGSAVALLIAVISLGCNDRRASHPSADTQELHVAVVDRAMVASHDAVRATTRGWPAMDAPAEPEIADVPIVELDDFYIVELDDDDARVTFEIDDDDTE